MTRPPRAGLRLFACSLALGALAGCANVPAWERGNLAKPQMAFDLAPSQTALMPSEMFPTSGTSCSTMLNSAIGIRPPSPKAIS